MNAPQDTAAAELQAILDTQRSAFKAEGPVAMATRIDRIDRCIALLVDNKDAICEAVDKDFGCRSRHTTLMTDIMTSLGSLKFVVQEQLVLPVRGQPLLVLLELCLRLTRTRLRSV